MSVPALTGSNIRQEGMGVNRSAGRTPDPIDGMSFAGCSLITYFAQRPFRTVAIGLGARDSRFSADPQAWPACGHAQGTPDCCRSKRERLSGAAGPDRGGQSRMEPITVSVVINTLDRADQLE